MKARQLRKVLESFANVYEEAGDEQTGNGLRSLANLLPDKGRQEARAFLAEIDKARQSLRGS